jgi:hypothetical protein
VNQQPYVELRDLLDTMSSDGAKTSQATWLYTLSTLSITLSLLVLTSRYWRRPMTLFIRKVFPCAHDQRPLSTQRKNRQATSKVPATSSANKDCPSCVAGRDENGEAEASPSAVPLQMEPEVLPGPGPATRPEAAERVYFAQSGKFQLRK